MGHVQNRLIIVVTSLLITLFVVSCGPSTSAPTQAETTQGEESAAAVEQPAEGTAEESGVEAEADEAASDEDAEASGAEAEESSADAEGSDADAEEAAAEAEAAEDESAEEAAPAQTGGGSGGRVDLDAIFPPGEGRELVLTNCTNCHSFVPIVIVGFNSAEWDRNAADHYDRVSGLTEDQRAVLYAYLKENFGPDDPVPDLPPELLEQWTSY